MDECKPLDAGGSLGMKKSVYDAANKEVAAGAYPPSTSQLNLSRF